MAVEDLKRLYAEDGRLGELAEFVNSVPNAPRIEASELDASAFMAAESDYMDNGVTERLKEYLAEYPHGTYEPQALYYLAENASEKETIVRLWNMRRVWFWCILTVKWPKTQLSSRLRVSQHLAKPSLHTPHLLTLRPELPEHVPCRKRDSG